MTQSKEIAPSVPNTSSVLLSFLLLDTETQKKILELLDLLIEISLQMWSNYLFPWLPIRDINSLKWKLEHILPKDVSDAIRFHSSLPEIRKIVSKSKYAAIMFVDFMNFTKFCQNKDAKEVFQIVNDILTPMAKLVLQKGGWVDKYLGDGFLAWFELKDNKTKKICIHAFFKLRLI